MGILEACAWLEATPLATKITESEWLFPTIETTHVLALTLVVGTIAMVDLRLLGFASREIGAVRLSKDLLPWTWTAFVVAAITGSLMFISAATKYYANIPFRIKMVLLVLAGTNMLVLHFGAWKSSGQWDMTLPTPRAVRLAAALSLVFWVGVVVSGRWIGFV